MRWKNRILKKAAISLSLSLFTSNVLLAYAPEANFWSERHKRTELASLPPGLNQLPTVLPHSIAPQIPKKLTNNLPRSIQSNVVPLIESLPQFYGTVHKISAPQKAQSEKTVIHIQDVHLNPEAQENIGHTVSVLINKGAVDLVALEGTFEPLKLSPIKKFKRQDVVHKVADYLFREKKISGAVHAALTSPSEIPSFVGVDDLIHYNANVEAYRQSISLVDATKERLNQAKQENERKKKDVLNSALASFDRTVQAHREERLSFGPYVDALSKHQPDYLNADIEIFLEAWKTENRLDFAKVERERTRLIKQLVEKLGKDHVSGLLEYSVAYRVGRIGHKDFYHYIQTLCEEQGINLAHYRHMNDYIQYVLLSDGIDPETLMEHVSKMERAGYDSLIQNQRERDLIQTSDRIYLTGRLIEFSLTPEEWDEYKASSPRSGEARRGFSVFEDFYYYAQARDEAMTANLLKAMDKAGASTAILVTGGFHSPGINQKLEEAGVTTVTFSPKISQVEDESGATYLSVFSQQKTPLDKLFEGEKLFVSPKPDAIHGMGPLAAISLQAESATPLTAPSQQVAPLPGARFVIETKKRPDGQIQVTMPSGKLVGDESFDRVSFRPAKRPLFGLRGPLLAFLILLAFPSLAAAGPEGPLPLFAIAPFVWQTVLLLGVVVVTLMAISKLKKIGWRWIFIPVELVIGIWLIFFLNGPNQPDEMPVAENPNVPAPRHEWPVAENPNRPSQPGQKPGKQIGAPIGKTKGVHIVRTKEGAWLNVHGRLWSGVPGFAYQPTPGKMHINQFERGRMAQLYKALLPVGGRGIDAKKYPDLVRLAKTRGGAPAQNHADLLARAGAKVIRTYNLAATTEADLRLVSRIFQWMYEEHGIMFVAGMYGPNERQVRFMVQTLRNNPGLLIYDGWNEIDIRPGTTPATYREIDRLAGIAKHLDPNHPIAIVVTQSIDAQGARAIKAMKNIDIVSVTIYDRDGQSAARYVRGLQQFFAPKAVVVGEIGVAVNVPPQERARRLRAIADALTMTRAGMPMPALFFIFFEFTPEWWKRDDNRWWFISPNNTPTPSYTSVSEVHQRWVQGPKADEVEPGEAPGKKQAPSVNPKAGKAPPVVSEILNERYFGVSWYARYKAITKTQSDRILRHQYLRATLELDRHEDLTGFHVDVKGLAEVGVYSLYVRKVRGEWGLYRRDGSPAKSKAVIRDDPKTKTVSVTIPVSEIGAHTRNITFVHVQSGKKQNGVPLNSRNVRPNRVTIEAFTEGQESNEEEEAEQGFLGERSRIFPLTIAKWFRAAAMSLLVAFTFFGFSGLASAGEIGAGVSLTASVSISSLFLYVLAITIILGVVMVWVIGLVSTWFDTRNSVRGTGSSRSWLWPLFLVMLIPLGWLGTASARTVPPVVPPLQSHTVGQVKPGNPRPNEKNEKKVYLATPAFDQGMDEFEEARDAVLALVKNLESASLNKAEVKAARDQLSDLADKKKNLFDQHTKSAGEVKKVEVILIILDRELKNSNLTPAMRNGLLTQFLEFRVNRSNMSRGLKLQEGTIMGLTGQLRDLHHRLSNLSLENQVNQRENQAQGLTWDRILFSILGFFVGGILAVLSLLRYPRLRRFFGIGIRSLIVAYALLGLAGIASAQPVPNATPAFASSVEEFGKVRAEVLTLLKDLGSKGGDSAEIRKSLLKLEELEQGLRNLVERHKESFGKFTEARQRLNHLNRELMFKDPPLPQRNDRLLEMIEIQASGNNVVLKIGKQERKGIRLNAQLKELRSQVSAASLRNQVPIIKDNQDRGSMMGRFIFSIGGLFLGVITVFVSFRIFSKLRKIFRIDSSTKVGLLLVIAFLTFPGIASAGTIGLAVVPTANGAVSVVLSLAIGLATLIGLKRFVANRGPNLNELSDIVVQSLQQVQAGEFDENTFAEDLAEIGLPAGRLGVEGNGEGLFNLTTRQRKRLARLVKTKLAAKNVKGLKFSQTRRTLLQLDRRRFQPIKKVIKDGDLALDIRVLDKADLSVAVAKIKTAKTAIGQHTLYVPVISSMKEELQTQVNVAFGDSYPGRIEYVESDDGFYFGDQNQIFNLELFLATGRVKNAAIAVEGEYYVTRKTWDLYKESWNIRLVVLAWLNDLMAVELEIDYLQTIDNFALAAIQA